MSTLGQLKAQKRIALAFLIVGILLMTYMITVEGELGAVPLLLVAGGIAAYFISRHRLGKHSA